MSDLDKPRTSVNIEKHQGDASALYAGFIQALNQRDQSAIQVESLSSDIAYVAKRGGEVVGILIGFMYGKCFQGQRLIVDPKQRGQNIGQSLLDEVKAEPAVDRIEFISTPIPGTYQGDKKIAVEALDQYYEKMGFKTLNHKLGTFYWDRQEQDSRK